MANDEQSAILNQGATTWNSWRAEHPQLVPDLKGLDLEEMMLNGADLSGANLRAATIQRAMLARANLRGADLSRAQIIDCDLRDADLSRALLDNAVIKDCHLSGARLEEASLRGAVVIGCSLDYADMTGANLRAEFSGGSMVRAKLTGARVAGANLRNVNLFAADLAGLELTRARLAGSNLGSANLQGAVLLESDLSDVNLRQTDLSAANLSGANLSGARLVQTNLEGTDLTGCRVYGTAVWDVVLDEKTRQSRLVAHPSVTVDSLEVAQFIYLLVKNEKIRQVIDTVTSKVVLILGCFSKLRKPTLDAIRDELVRLDRVPVMFDFDVPASKDATATVETLARIARFIIADLTDPSSIPHELATIVPHLRTTPVLPLRNAGAERKYGMFDDFQHPVRGYRWVLPTHEYTDEETLIAELPVVLEPAERMADALRDPA